MPNADQVRAIFEPFGRGDAAGFFANVDDNVDWTVKGTYSQVAGHYHSKAEFQAGTKILSSTWAGPLKLVVQNIICDSSSAAVELKAIDTACKNGLPFTNEYTWICYFNEENKIVKIRAYMDTDLVTRAIEQNS